MQQPHALAHAARAFGLQHQGMSELDRGPHPLQNHPMDTRTETPDPDGRPEPPEKPLPGDCCDSGCARCVRDVYADQLEQYRRKLAAWKQRHPGAPD